LFVCVLLCYAPLHGLAVPVGLGTYVGNPNGNSKLDMTEFENHFDSFSKAMGTKPTFMNTFVDYSSGWDSWVPNAQWGAWSWSLSNRSKNLIPVIGLPMLPSSYYNTEDVGMNEVIKGAHDAVFTGIVKAFVAQNYTHLYFRIGWEANGNWYSWNWNAKNSSGDPILPQYLAAWRRIANLVHSVQGAKIYTVWNPTVAQWSAFDISTAYPGDDVVDVIGLDIYSTVWPGSLYDWQYNNGTMAKNVAEWSKSSVNREHYWTYPGANQWAPTSMQGWGMLSHLQFAKLHKKPISFPESGVGVGPSYPDNGIMDDGDFPVYLRKQIDAAGLECLYINIWDVNVGDGLWRFSDGNKPAAAAAWRTAFGK